MAKTEILTKRLAIDKSYSNTVVIVAVAAFITVFCLMAANAVFSQNSYQSKVENALTTARQDLQNNITSFNALKSNFNKFNNASTNIIGGLNDGTGQNGGTNQQIIDDALPTKYDFPALTTSLQKILSNPNYQLEGISGTDQELTEVDDSQSPDPTASPMPFTFSIDDASSTTAAQLIDELSRSIRPIQIQTMYLSGTDASLQLSVQAQTYFQPSKAYTITQQEVNP